MLAVQGHGRPLSNPRIVTLLRHFVVDLELLLARDGRQLALVLRVANLASVVKGATVFLHMARKLLVAHRLVERLHRRVWQRARSILGQRSAIRVFVEVRHAHLIEVMIARVDGARLFHQHALVVTLVEYIVVVA